MLQTTDPHIITTQIDSLHTQVQIIDTTVTHVHVYDTIVTHVYDTIQPDLITVYERLITAQDDKFEFTLYAIAIIVTLLIVAVTAFNFFGAKELFKIEFKNMLDGERENIKKAALEDVEKELHYIKGESARLFANSNSTNPINIANCIHWWSTCVKEYTLADRELGVSISYDKLKIALENAVKSKAIFVKSFKDARSTFIEMREKVAHLPNIVSEKKEIIKMIDELEEYYNQAEGIVKEAEVVE